MTSAGAPAPIFIQTEDGQGALDVARFPMAATPKIADPDGDAAGQRGTEGDIYGRYLSRENGDFPIPRRAGAGRGLVSVVMCLFRR